ncbi:MAG: pantetheine-phosphate adenylyltransferase [Acidobacteriota bacterium]
MTKAVYPGSFDPVTNGHLDLVCRAANLFDEVVVAVLVNPAKGETFDVRERVEMLRRATRDFQRVRVDSFDGLLVNYIHSAGAQVIVRGLRAVSDFEYEFQMALMNRRLNSAVETVYMMPAETYTYLSSRLVREVASLGGTVSGLVPEAVAEALARRLGPAAGGAS